MSLSRNPRAVLSGKPNCFEARPVPYSRRILNICLSCYIFYLLKMRQFLFSVGGYMKRNYHVVSFRLVFRQFHYFHLIDFPVYPFQFSVSVNYGVRTKSAAHCASKLVLLVECSKLLSNFTQCFSGIRLS